MDHSYIGLVFTARLLEVIAVKEVARTRHLPLGPLVPRLGLEQAKDETDEGPKSR